MPSSLNDKTHGLTLPSKNKEPGHGDEGLLCKEADCTEQRLY